MNEIKENASAKAFAQLRLAKQKLKDTEDSDPVEYDQWGTSKDNFIAFYQKEYEVWKYITTLIEKDIK